MFSCGFCGSFKNTYFIEYFWTISSGPNLIKSILIHEYQHNSTRVNTSQHESTWVRHESTQVNTSPTQINKSQHVCDTNQHESTRVRNESTQVNKSKKVKKCPRRVNASQQKSGVSLTRIWESITNCRNISCKVYIYDFSFLVQCLHCTWQLRYRHRFCIGYAFFLH